MFSSPNVDKKRGESNPHYACKFQVRNGTFLLISNLIFNSEKTTCFLLWIASFRNGFKWNFGWVAWMTFQANVVILCVGRKILLSFERVKRKFKIPLFMNWI
jgi:hypothetical protein